MLVGEEQKKREAFGTFIAILVLVLKKCGKVVSPNIPFKEALKPGVFPRKIPASYSQTSPSVPFKPLRAMDEEKPTPLSVATGEGLLRIFHLTGIYLAYTIKR